MKVLLLFPPDWLPSEPYLSLPSLTSVLRPAGHEVIQKDVNVEMYDLMFSEPFLRQVENRIEFELRHLQHLAGQQSLNDEERTLMRKLESCTEDYFENIIQSITEAKRILRDREDFYNIDKLEWATGIVHETMAVISLGYYPAQICFPPIETDLIYKPFMSTEIVESLEDEQINVYRDIYKALVHPVMEKEQPGVVGISIVQQKQLIPTFTFCKLIKEHFPKTHICLGGNIVTRLREVLPEKQELCKWFE